MSILALDTATMVSSVAVASADKLLAELIVETRLTHSETLMPHIAQVLEMAGQAKESLEGIAVSIGPGSFTGLRIGLAAAKGMAYTLGVPIIGVPTLAALAYHFPVPGIYTAVLLDAQKGNAYAALYHWQDGAFVEDAAVQVLPIETVLRQCGTLDAPVMLLGDVVRKKIAGRALPANVFMAPPYMLMPRAANVAALGLQMLADGQTGNVMDMEPVYIRRSEAEVLWEKRQKAGQS